MGSIADLGIAGILAHLFFVTAGVSIGVRAADDLMQWKSHRAAKQLARDN
jgi:hypothetical protein